MFEREPGSNPEKQLWQEVLLQVVNDAILGVPKSNNAKNRDTAIRLCKEARDYLTKPSRDLTITCTLAGMDPQAVIERMRVQIANSPSPEELADSAKASRATKNKRKEKPKAVRKVETITYNGETLTIPQWSERTGVMAATISRRLRLGWNVGEALFVTPEESKRRKTEAINAMARVARASARAARHEPTTTSTEPTRQPMTITHNGEALTVGEWSKRTGVNQATIRQRLGKGWPMAEVLREA